MNTHDYKPDVKDNEGTLLFDGVIVVKKPNWKQRQKTRTEIGKLSEGESEAFMMDLAEQSIQSIDLKVKGQKAKISSFDELMDYQEGMYIALKLSEIQTSGIALGNGLQALLKPK